MKAKRIGTVVVLALVGSLAMVFLFLDRDGIDQAAYDRIHLGMPIQEVRSVLGRPGQGVEEEGHRGPPREVADIKEEGAFENRPDDNVPGRRWYWSGRDAAIMVRLGKDDEVTDRMFIRMKPLTLGERLRYLFGF